MLWLLSRPFLYVFKLLKTIVKAPFKMIGAKRNHTTRKNAKMAAQAIKAQKAAAAAGAAAGVVAGAAGAAAVMSSASSDNAAAPGAADGPVEPAGATEQVDPGEPTGDSVGTVGEHV